MMNTPPQASQDTQVLTRRDRVLLLLAAVSLLFALSPWAIGQANDTSGDPSADPETEAAAEAEAEDADAPVEGRVRVANLIYGGGKTAVCLADGFLVSVARETQINVQRTFDRVQLADEALFEHPFAVMTGEGEFTLSDDERENLKAYLERGGFLLASAGCSNGQWADNFEAAVTAMFGDDALEPIDSDHALFDQLYSVERLEMKRATQNDRLWGLTIDGRLAVVYSPQGLNDTANAGGGCCCCGGNEVRNARQVNANILVYALTR